MKVKCSHCGYEWETDSEMYMISCPSCNYKTKNPSKDFKKKDKLKAEPS